MPELPEVEVVRRSLEKKLKTSMILKDVRIHNPRLRFQISTHFFKMLCGEKFRTLSRVGKFLIFEFENNHGFFSHLGMTGKWFVEEPPEKKHLHLSLFFEDTLQNKISFHYQDVRKFGFVKEFSGMLEKQSYRDRYGKDPLLDAWTDEEFWKTLRPSLSPIKNVLLDQAKVFGIGNIYASEILHEAGVKPQRLAKSVTKKEACEILRATKRILAAAIEKGGSSIRDFVQGDGAPGSYQDDHLVYGRGDQPCRTCGGLIRQRAMSGRSTYWCTACQK